MKIFKSFFFYGMVVAFVLLLSSLVWTQNVIKISGGIGVAALVLALVMSGSLVSGDRYRGNYGKETTEERNERMGVSFGFIKFGVPSLVVYIILSLLQ
ncbi:DUF5316 domain-containing protein [Neobacillus mesonae]|nr:DUF5316 domain-containing protein [Neobacillus mesonae]